ncbi:hypothetical protein PCANC_28887, partial [Puccinia coronata f. sp. avenae]
MTLFNRKSNQTSDPNNNTTAKDKQKWSRRPATHLDPEKPSAYLFLNCITFAPLGGILLWAAQSQCARETTNPVHEFTINYTNCDTNAPQVPAGGDTNNGFQNLPSDKYGYHFALAHEPHYNNDNALAIPRLIQTHHPVRKASSLVCLGLTQAASRPVSPAACRIASASTLNPNAGFNQFSGTPNSSSNLNVTLPTVQLGLDQIEAQSRRLVSKIRKNNTLDASLSLFGELHL